MSMADGGTGTMTVAEQIVSKYGNVLTVTDDTGQYATRLFTELDMLMALAEMKERCAKEAENVEPPVTPCERDHDYYEASRDAAERIRAL